MSERDQINEQINSLFASNDVTVDGPGEEAFWNAVEDMEKVNPTAASELEILSTRWLLATGAERGVVQC